MYRYVKPVGYIGNTCNMLKQRKAKENEEAKVNDQKLQKGSHQARNGKRVSKLNLKPTWTKTK